MLPITFSFDPTHLSEADLLRHSYDADQRRRQLETACHAHTHRPCVVMLAPVYTTALADDPTLDRFLPGTLNGIYILGGDASNAMHILANTRLERALQDAYARGIPIAGTGGGMMLLARQMIVGYASSLFTPENALQQGAVTLWDTDNQRGIAFGSRAVLLESYLWERGRLARLLNALAQPNTPSIGIGIDNHTGGYWVDDATFGNLFGTGTALIVDAHSFDAKATATFGDASGTLSMRGMLVHLLAPGDFSYSISDHQTNRARLPESAQVRYDTLRLEAGAGALLLGGRIFGTQIGEEAEILNRLIASAGGGSVSIALIAIGFDDENRARATLDQYRLGLLALHPNLTLTQHLVAHTPFISDLMPNGAIIVADDSSQLHAEALSLLVPWHQAGVPLFFDDSAVGLAGVAFMVDASGDMPLMRPGLGLVDAVFEPRLLGDNRYARWLALAYHHPDHIAVGLSQDTALFIHQHDATVLGLNGMFVLDLGMAVRDVGANGQRVFVNGVLDVLSAGDSAR